MGLGEAQGWRVPEVLCPVQVAQALLRFCRLSALARGCWGRSCQRTSSWMLSACSWSGTTSTSPAQCKVLTHPPATPFRLSARMAQAVRPFCAGGGGKEDTGPSAAVVSPLLDEHRSLFYFCFKCALGSVNAVHWGIALGSSKQPSALVGNVQSPEPRDVPFHDTLTLRPQRASHRCWV